MNQKLSTEKIITLSIQMPQILQEKLQSRAKRNLRSFNNELLYILCDRIQIEDSADRRIQKFLKDWNGEKSTKLSTMKRKNNKVKKI